jgi:hypothetical protein
VAWHHNCNELFSVRSAYHQQWLHKFGGNITVDQASGVGDEEVWSRLWQLAVPGKIKVFGWRVLHGLLPCRGILANRHIENSSSWPACHDVRLNLSLITNQLQPAYQPQKPSAEQLSYLHATELKKFGRGSEYGIR